MNWSVKYSLNKKSHLEEYTHPIPEPENFVKHAWEHHASFRQYCSELAERFPGTTPEQHRDSIHQKVISDPVFYRKISSIHLDGEHGEGVDGVAGEHPHKHIKDEKIKVDIPDALELVSKV